MPLVDLLGDFGLNAEAIREDREVSQGLAAGHQRAIEAVEDDRAARTVRLLACATELRRAAAHSVLLSDWTTAKEMFDGAGHVYRAAGAPYGLMMFACSARPMEEAISLFGFPEGDKIQLAYLLLGRATAGQQIHREMLEPLVGASGSPVGILGLPVGAYIDLALAFGAPENTELRIYQAALPFLVAYSSAISRARESDHWDSLILPFHPADPDILGVAFCAEHVLRGRFQGSLTPAIRQLPLSGIAANILSSAIAEGFGDQRRPPR